MVRLDFAKNNDRNQLQLIPNINLAGIRLLLDVKALADMRY